MLKQAGEGTGGHRAPEKPRNPLPFAAAQPPAPSSSACTEITLKACRTHPVVAGSGSCTGPRAAQSTVTGAVPAFPYFKWQKAPKRFFLAACRCLKRPLAAVPLWWEARVPGKKWEKKDDFKKQ